MLSMLNEIKLHKELQNVHVNNVFGQNSKNTTAAKQISKHKNILARAGN